MKIDNYEYYHSRNEIVRSHCSIPVAEGRNGESERKVQDVELASWKAYDGKGHHCGDEQEIGNGCREHHQSD